MNDRRLRIAGSALLGVFARCTEDLVLLPLEVERGTVEALEAALCVASMPIMIGDSSVVGSLVAGNSEGFVVTSYASKENLETLRKHGKVARLPGKISAAGNVILVNDTAALVHPGLSRRAMETVAETLGVAVKKGTIGGLKTVGMTAVASNRGILAHPRISEGEVKVLEELFGLPVEVGSVNFGSPLVGSGILANGKGYVAGSETSGPELGRIEDALGFIG